MYSTCAGCDRGYQMCPQYVMKMCRHEMVSVGFTVHFKLGCVHLFTHTQALNQTCLFYCATIYWRIDFPHILVTWITAHNPQVTPWWQKYVYFWIITVLQSLNYFYFISLCVCSHFGYYLLIKSCVVKLLARIWTWDLWISRCSGHWATKAIKTLKQNSQLYMYVQSFKWCFKL